MGINTAGNTKANQLRDFLAGSLEEIDDCEDLQLQAIVNFKVDLVDAYDSDCDDKATTNAVFMENLSPVDSLNDDTAEPPYDSDMPSESPPLQSYEPTVVQQPPTYQPDTVLAIPTFLLSDDLIESLNKAMIFLSLVIFKVDSLKVIRAMLEIIKLRSMGINTVGNTEANQLRVIRCYNCNGEAKSLEEINDYKDLQLQATTNFKADQVDAYDLDCDDKATTNAIFKENLSPVGSLNDETVEPRYDSGILFEDFLAGSLEEIDDCEDLQLQAIVNFKVDLVDAYDSDCDDKATTNAVFMENLSPVDSLNDDTAEPPYDSDMPSEVLHYDTYHIFDMLNFNIQELGYIENIVSNNESYDELTGNSNVISYTNYMLTIRNDEDNYVYPPVQKNDMMLSVIKQMKSQVEKCNMVNQESKSRKESLTSELERYKDRVRFLEYAIKDGHSEQEAYLCRELYTTISNRNRKVSKYEKQVFSQTTQMKNLNNHIAFLKKQESYKRYEKNISEIVDLEKAKKELKNIVFKVGQSAQTMHMLTKH
nr:hypothetical protein [Tanacetum cinerariifolium]